MNTREKILLVQLILEDIESNWAYGYGCSAENRALKAKSLCEEIAIETSNDEYLILADNCDVYISSSKKWGDWDGRFFRQAFPMGHRNMNKLHNLKHTYNNKSNDFQSTAREYITSFEYLFEDYES